MGELIQILQRKRFSLAEAESLLPVIRRITQEAVQDFLILEEKLKRHQHAPDQWKEIEEEIAGVLNHWSEKIFKLGCQPKGIWLVDFDNGKGYYCWRYGDEGIDYFHGYHEGFAGRTAIRR
ncbi:MAG TPA: DUF2203 domain-containing protein [Deltaproteobacteria bacterium]|nr:DUF2203 domain-containing protein [Deltaproteobacteria bacterium]